MDFLCGVSLPLSAQLGLCMKDFSAGVYLTASAEKTQKLFWPLEKCDWKKGSI